MNSLPARGRVGLDDPGTAHPLASSRGQGGLDGAGAVSTDVPRQSPVSAPLDLDAIEARAAAAIDGPRVADTTLRLVAEVRRLRAALEATS